MADIRIRQIQARLNKLGAAVLFVSLPPRVKICSFWVLLSIRLKNSWMNFIARKVISFGGLSEDVSSR